MKQDSSVVAKAIKECELITRRQQEEAERNTLGSLYSFATEISGKNDSAAEMEALMKLDEAVEGKKAANEIMNLATDWYSEGREAGFRMGFHMAMRLCMEGMSSCMY